MTTTDDIRYLLRYTIGQAVRFERWDAEVSGNYACFWRRQYRGSHFARVWQVSTHRWRAEDKAGRSWAEADGRAAAVRKLLEHMVELGVAV